MTYLIDTHSHIDLADFEDKAEVVKRAKENGIEKIIVPAVDRASFDSVLNVANEFDGVYCAIGIHPEEVKKVKSSDFSDIKEFAKNKKVVAIGEVGLDYYWDKTYVKEQIDIFKKQIEIAQELHLPLLIHEREAHKDAFDLLAEVKDIPVVMHCFSGSLEFANECIKKGFYIALGGVVTFKNAKKTHNVAKNIPLDKLLLETDAPYMTPEPYRGKRNEPMYVKYVAQRIADLRECSFEEIAMATTQNANKIFNFGDK